MFIIQCNVRNKSVTYVTLRTLQNCACHKILHEGRMGKSFGIWPRMIPEKAFQKGIWIKTSIGHLTKLFCLFCYVRYIKNADFQKNYIFFQIPTRSLFQFLVVLWIIVYYYNINFITLNSILLFLWELEYWYIFTPDDKLIIAQLQYAITQKL